MALFGEQRRKRGTGDCRYSGTLNSPLAWLQTSLCYSGIQRSICVRYGKTKQSMCDYCAYMPTNILGLNVFLCTECSLCFYAQMCKAHICVHVFVSLHTKHLCFCINLSACVISESQRLQTDRQVWISQCVWNWNVILTSVLSVVQPVRDQWCKLCHD